MANVTQTGGKTLSVLGKAQGINGGGSYYNDFVLDFALDTDFTYNASENNALEAVNSIMFDNCRNEERVDVVVSDVSNEFTYIIPPKATGIISVVAQQNSNIKFSSNTTVIVPVILSSLAQPSYVFYPDGEPSTAKQNNVGKDSVLMGVNSAFSENLTRGASKLVGFKLPDPLPSGDTIEIQASIDNGVTFYSIYNSQGQPAYYDVGDNAGIWYVDNLIETEIGDVFRFVARDSVDDFGVVNQAQGINIEAILSEV